MGAAPFNNGGATALRTGDQFRSSAKLNDEPTDLLVSRTTYGLPAPVKERQRVRGVSGFDPSRFWMLAAPKRIDGAIKLLLAHSVLGHDFALVVLSIVVVPLIVSLTLAHLH